MERLESFRKNAEFDRIWRECKEIRKDIIIDRALCKRADASFAKFLLSEDGGGGGEDQLGGGISYHSRLCRIPIQAWARV